MKIHICLGFLLLLLASASCDHIKLRTPQTEEEKRLKDSAKKAEKEKKDGKQPAQAKSETLPGYNVDKPTQIFKMPDELREISGLTLRNGDPSSVYAEEDEDGKIFRFALGSSDIAITQWGKKGDYEDIQLCNGNVVMLKSSGSLYTFSLQDADRGNVRNVNTYDHILPKGEYEGLYADEETDKIYALCKHCNEKMSATNSGYIFSVSPKGEIKQEGYFSINVKDIIKMTEDKMYFKPSALARNENTGDWYILSSINKLIVLTDGNWHVKGAYALDPLIYNQPEGIAFDKDNNLYISNEKGSTSSATIIKLAYQKP